MYITNKITKAYRRPAEGFIDNIAMGAKMEGWRQDGWFVATKINGVDRSGWYIPGADVDAAGQPEPQPGGGVSFTLNVSGFKPYTGELERV